MPAQRTSRTYTISLPPDLAAKAETLARRDSRSMSELFREAFRAYYVQETRRQLQEFGAYADSIDSTYTEADIPDLIRQVRREKAAEKA